MNLPASPKKYRGEAEVVGEVKDEALLGNKKKSIYLVTGLGWQCWEASATIIRRGCFLCVLLRFAYYVPEKPPEMYFCFGLCHGSLAHCYLEGLNLISPRMDLENLVVC